MKVGVFSDVHSNLEALEVVLAFYKEQKVMDYICAGDVVGYGPDPNKCIEKLREVNPTIVCGNHDLACCGMKEITWFNPDAQKAILWTRSVLDESNRLYILNLPKKVVKWGMTVVHGSPRDPIDEYLLSVQQMLENINEFETNICVVGHSHFPFVFRKTKTDYHLFTEDLENITFKISNGDKYIINVGSIGQPRDGDNRGCCCIYHVEKKEFRFYRLSYNFSLTQDKMRKHRLPAFLIERLSWGR